MLVISGVMTAHAAPERSPVLIVLSNTSSAYLRFAHKLGNQLQRSGITSKIINLDELRPDQDALFIATGTQAAIELSQKLVNKMVFYTLITKDTYDTIKTKLVQNNQHAAVLYLEQPIERQIQVIQKIAPELKRFGILYTDKSAEYCNNFINLEKKFGFMLKTRKISPNENVLLNLDELLTDIDVLITIPDHHIYAQDNIKSILLNTYYKGIPLIGFSRAFTNAGAYLSFYSTPDMYAEQTYQAINSSFEKGKEYYPNNYTMEINPAVARSLRLPYINDAEINEIKNALK